MSVVRLILLLVTLQFSVMVLSDDISYTVPAYISDSNKLVLSAWLKRHPEYRLATEEDCNCKWAIDNKRTYGNNANPNYHPYYVSNDFNKDKVADLAVVFIKPNIKEKYYFAIFNGPLSLNSEPVYFNERTSGGFFHGAEANLETGKLCVGNFGSECGSLEASGTGYEESWPED